MMQGLWRCGFLAFCTIFLLGVSAAAAAQSALTPGTPAQISLPPLNYVSNFYVDTDGSAKQLTVSVSGSGSVDVDLFVRFGTPFPSSPVLVSEDLLTRYSHYHSYSSSSAESIIVLPSSHVPLVAGRWYIAVINSDQRNLATTATLTAQTFTSPQVANINIDFSSPVTNPSDPSQNCDIAPWTDSTAATPIAGNPGTTLGQQRQNALKYAVQQITQALLPPVPVTIHACWAPLDATSTRAVIANATPVMFLVDEPDYGGYVLPLRYTWYAITEAVRAGGASQCGLLSGPCGGVDNEEILATFNERIGTPDVLGGEQFYFGYTPDSSQSSIDFVSIAMHELTHGLGFIGLANTDSTLGPIGAKAGIDSTGASIDYQNLSKGPYDDVYDVNVANVNTSNNTYTPFMGYEVNGTGDAARAAALVSFNGLRWSEATAVNSLVNQNRNLPAPQNFPLLHAPNPIEDGSTLSHTEQADDLMNAVYPFPPPRTMGLAQPMLAPLGWSSTPASAPIYAQPVPSNWFDRSHAGHGFDFQLVKRNPSLGDEYILVFYTYDANGKPEWYFSQGNLVDGVFLGSLVDVGEHNVTLLYSTYGSNHGPGQLQLTQQDVIGTVVVDFNQASRSPACRNVDRSDQSMLGVMSWTIGNDSDDWCMEPLIPLNRHASPDFNGHWYAPADSSWGMEDPRLRRQLELVDRFRARSITRTRTACRRGLSPAARCATATQNLQVLARTNGYCRTCTPPATSATAQIGTLTLNLTPGSGTSGSDRHGVVHDQLPRRRKLQPQQRPSPGDHATIAADGPVTAQAAQRPLSRPLRFGIWKISTFRSVRV